MFPYFLGPYCIGVCIGIQIGKQHVRSYTSYYHDTAKIKILEQKIKEIAEYCEKDVDVLIEAIMKLKSLE